MQQLTKQMHMAADRKRNSKQKIRLQARQQGPPFEKKGGGQYSRRKIHQQIGEVNQKMCDSQGNISNWSPFFPAVMMASGRVEK
jgi:hypothetical protein